MNEADAFNNIVEERIEGGFVPDLQNTEENPYFYNNVWRYPMAAQLHFGGVIEFICRNKVPGRILEIGCGSGFISLELARLGCNVFGIDISEKSIKAAKQTARGNSNSGNLFYKVSSLEETPELIEFDNLVFVGAMHHLQNLDKVIEKCEKLLAPNGRIIVVEPARENLGIEEALVMVLIRTILNIQDKWYSKESTPFNQKTLEKRLEVTLQELQEGRDLDEGEQSPNDGENSGQDIQDMLELTFKQVDYKDKTSLFSRLAGGIRGERAGELIKFLHAWDKQAVFSGLLASDGFMWAGEVS
jgi:2-polyprenyl-3-methyl-5-hydroxy-6-metoxy-1,4-benzoquinol methylase